MTEAAALEKIAVQLWWMKYGLLAVIGILLGQLLERR